MNVKIPASQVFRIASMLFSVHVNFQKAECFKEAAEYLCGVAAGQLTQEQIDEEQDKADILIKRDTE